MILRKILSAIGASIISKNPHRIYMSEQMAERILRAFEEIQRAQDQFAIAMTQYAEQLQSHTGAIEGLSKASHELTKSATEQNKFFTQLTKLVEQPPAGVEQILPEAEEESEAKNIVFPPGCYRRRCLRKKDEQVLIV